MKINKKNGVLCSRREHTTTTILNVGEKGVENASKRATLTRKPNNDRQRESKRHETKNSRLLIKICYYAQKSNTGKENHEI